MVLYQHDELGKSLDKMRFNSSTGSAASAYSSQGGEEKNEKNKQRRGSWHLRKRGKKSVMGGGGWAFLRGKTMNCLRADIPSCGGGWGRNRENGEVALGGSQESEIQFYGGWQGGERGDAGRWTRVGESPVAF